MMDAVEAVTGRRSVRQFLPDPVSDETIRAILAGASRAASGTNIQPWLVHVATGAAKARLTHAVMAAAEAGQASLEYVYQPEVVKEPYLARRRKIGYDLYAKYGIARDDYPARKAAMLRNYTFFGAPVGLFFTMERDHAQGAWIDCGMFLANVMTLARARGLETCPQQAWCNFGTVVHEALGIPDNQVVITGMALGLSDPDAAVNTLVSERAGVDEFATWHR